jgi:hypothetical protein
LLTSVTVPVSLTAVVGSNETFSVAVCPGFSVVGNASPEMLNPVPVTDPELMVSGAVPVDVIRTDCVDVVFTVTFPKATLVEAIVHAPEIAFSCNDVALLTPAAVAVIVAVCAVLTAEAVAVNAALVALAGTVTEAGTVSAELLLASATANPPLGAAAVRLTVQASVTAPVSEALLQFTPASAAGATPVPLRLIVAVPPDALLLTVTAPVSDPAAVGSNDTFRTALCPGFKVTGALTPDAENPVPLIPIALIVSAAVPVDDRVTA